MRMWFKPRAMVVVAGLAITVAGSAAPFSWASSAAPARTVRVRVEGIARTGQVVTLDFAKITGTRGSALVFGRQVVSIHPGLYWVGAQVHTPGPSGSETLVLRRLRITRSRTVYLDARPGKLVRFALNVPGAADQTDIVGVCLGGAFAGGGAGAAGDPGTVYVVPVRSRIITFGYGSFWQGPAAGYLIAGHRRGAVPSVPSFRGALSRMAKLTIAFRQGTTVGAYNNPNLLSRGPCGAGWFNLSFIPSSGSMTEYVTAGPWRFSVLADPDSWTEDLRLVAEHSYADVFGGAVWGPSTQYAPQTEGDGLGRILFYPAAPFADPRQPNGFYCCGKSSITLSFRGHVLKHEVLIDSSGRLFIARAQRAGWYTMAIRSGQSIPHGVIPASLLSKSETVNWRFYAAPRSTPSGEQKELPVRVARILALGLNIDNQAAASGTTPVRIQFVEPHGRGFPRAPRYSVRTARLLASFDGGKTWQAVPLTRHRLFWLGIVHDPASGFVALRTTVTDSRGDRSEQTIFQAYVIG
jgi:hypothetical protein